jgi:hypothetical protein
MLPSRRRKPSQASYTSTAVNLGCRITAEPKHPASFTYLQIHAQVLHLVPFQGVVLPRRASVFFSGRMGPLRLLSKCPKPFRKTLLALSNQAPALCWCGCSTLGKSIFLHASTLWPKAQTRFILHQRQLLFLWFPQMESLKVIALDKIAVNNNLSSGPKRN